MPKEVKSYRIPPYLLDFIKEYKAAKKIEHSTDVLIYALRVLKLQWEDEKKRNPKYDLEFVSPKIENDLYLSPKDKVLKRLEKSPQFRKEEYKIVVQLTPEQIEDYKENYQDLGMTLQEYYVSHVKD